MLLKGLVGLSALSAAPACKTPSRQRVNKREWMALENQHPGTRDWLLTNTRIDPKTKYRSPAIEGFCSHTSIEAGETLDIFVSTNLESDFTISFYRMGFYGGAGGRHMLTLGPLKGTFQPDPEIGRNRVRECQWKSSLTLKIPSNWLSGVYVGKLTTRPENLQSYVIFIVRDDRKADYIFQCSDTTWQAYNRWPDNFSLYDDGNSKWFWGPSVAISFDRPYGKYCQIVDQPLSIGSGEFFLWEFPFVYWMESLGYDVTYVSNLDVHTNADALLRARGFLSVGHDEYYSIEMFEGLQRAIRRGLNVGFFSGNTCCGRIELTRGRTGQADRVFTRTDFFGPRDEAELKRFPAMALLPHASPNANQLVGARSVAPITGGADWICNLPDHWIFEQTGMQKGEGIPGLVGWEWHGDPADLPGLEIVATGVTRNNLKGPEAEGIYTATVYPGPKSNFVFNASTCWWADGLSEPPGYIRPSVYTTPKGPDRRVQQITRNILDRMLL